MRLRDSWSFLRNPAAFVAGPGLLLGDFYRVRAPGYRLFVVTDPDLVERILSTEADRFEKSRLYWRELRRSFGESMGALEGERWQYLHRLQRPFFTPKAVHDYLPLIDQCTSHYSSLLGERLGSPGSVPLLDWFAALNARITLAALFGQEDDDNLLEVARRIADGHTIIGWRSRFPWNPLLGWLNGANRRGRSHVRFFGDYADRLRGSPAAADPRRLLHALTRIDSDARAPKMPDNLLRNEVTFQLGASTETQAAVEAWTLYLLWKHPAVLDRMREEISAATGGSLPNSAHLPQLPHVKQVVQETLRLYPPVYAILRDCLEPARLANHAVRRHDVMLISVYGLHRNPRLWQEPTQFRPERFEPERATAIRRYQYLPFGAGKHVCIGRHLALPSMILAVAQFAQRFDWTFPDADVQPDPRPGLKPALPFDAIVARRFAAAD